MKTLLSYELFLEQVETNYLAKLSTSQQELAYRCYTRLGFGVNESISIASTLKN